MAKWQPKCLYARPPTKQNQKLGLGAGAQLREAARARALSPWDLTGNTNKTYTMARLPARKKTPTVNHCACNAGPQAAQRNNMCPASEDSMMRVAKYATNPPKASKGPNARIDAPCKTRFGKPQDCQGADAGRWHARWCLG